MNLTLLGIDPTQVDFQWTKIWGPFFYFIFYHLERLPVHHAVLEKCGRIILKTIVKNFCSLPSTVLSV